MSDAKTQLLGGNVAAGSSPRRLLVSTVGDELKMAGGGKPRCIGVSLKDRAAILPSGHMANGAFWFDTQVGNFVTSTYYYKNCRVGSRNSTRRAGGKVPREDLDGAQHAGRPTSSSYTELEATPFGNELIEAFAEKALDAGNLGSASLPTY